MRRVPKRPLLPGRSAFEGDETYRKERIMSLGHNPDDKLLTMAEVAVPGAAQGPHAA